MTSPPSFDPGLTQKYGGKLRRGINPDGTFNVERRGLSWRDLNLYLYLVNSSWTRFWTIIVGGYIFVNVLFALVYFAVGVDQLAGANTSTPWRAFLSAFFFSTETITTVGYGNLAPQGVLVTLIAAFEAMLGVLSFTVGAGLLYGRFSRPSARLRFSERAIIAPYRGRTALMFRIINLRSNLILELEANVILMTVENVNGQLQRKYTNLKLERSRIQFIPISWTLVHPLENDSPLYGKSVSDLAAEEAEVLIQIKAFDDTFSQYVHTRYSYRYDEIVWGARFLPSFEIGDEGHVVLHVDRVHATEPAELPE